MMEDKSCKTSRWRMLKAQLNNLRPQEFKRKIDTVDDPIIVDVRTPEEFAVSHIENAINICYLADDFWPRIELLSPAKYIFVYCRTGRRSIRACTLMRNGGFDNSKVFNLEGGYGLWQEQMN